MPYQNKDQKAKTIVPKIVSIHSVNASRKKPSTSTSQRPVARNLKATNNAHKVLGSSSSTKAKTKTTKHQPNKSPVKPTVPAASRQIKPGVIDLGINTVKGWYERILTYYGVTDRPDLIYLFGLLSCTCIVFVIFKLSYVWDKNFGFLGGLGNKLRVWKRFGLSSLSMQKPMTPVELDKYFSTMRDTVKLSQSEQWNIKRMAVSRQAHDAYYTLRPHYRDPAKSLAYQMARMMMLFIFQIVLQVLPYFLAGYLLWALLKYLSYWTKASLGFLIEVQYKFIVDWIKAEISKIFAEIINVIVKVLTFGIKKGKTVNVTMPSYPNYVNAWWKKYIKPLLDNIDDEYGCRVDAAKRALAKALGWILLPLKQIYIWYAKLRKYGLDLPYDAFKDLVLKAYPLYVQQNGKFADDLVELDKRFYNMLKRDVVKAQRKSKKVVTTPRGTVNPIVDLREQPKKSQDTCAHIK